MDLVELIIQIIVISDIIFLLTVIFTEKENPSKIAVWSIVFILLPIVGFILYLFIGQTYYSDRTFRLKGVKDEEMRQYKAQDEAYARTEPNPEYASIMQTMQHFGSLGYTKANDVQLYTYGEDKFKAFFDDIRAAKECVHIEYYIIRNDELGNEFMSILTQKVKEGVCV